MPSDPMICPCCRRPFDPGWIPVEALPALFRGRIQTRLLSHLIEHFGAPRSVHQIADAIYSDAIDGGPEWAEQSVQVMVATMRRKMRDAGVGWTIHGKCGQGYMLVRGGEIELTAPASRSVNGAGALARRRRSAVA